YRTRLAILCTSFPVELCSSHIGGLSAILIPPSSIVLEGNGTPFVGCVSGIRPGYPEYGIPRYRSTTSPVLKDDKLKALPAGRVKWSPDHSGRCEGGWRYDLACSGINP